MGECSERSSRVGAEAGVRPPRRPFVAHPAGYPWRDGRLRSSLLFHRLVRLLACRRRLARLPSRGNSLRRGSCRLAAQPSCLPRFGELAVAFLEDLPFSPGQPGGGNRDGVQAGPQGRVKLEEAQRQREATGPDRRRRVRRRRTNRRLTCRGRPQDLVITRRSGCSSFQFAVG